MVAGECNIDLGEPASERTSGGDIAALSSYLDLPSGITHSAGLNTLLKVRAVNAAQWDAFLNLDNTGTGCCQASAAGSGTPRYLKVYIGTTLYTIIMTPA